MRIPKGVERFRLWARKSRLKPDRIAQVGAIVVYNLSLDIRSDDDYLSKVERVLKIVSEESALRWMK